jgi:hypothetical protein
MPVGEKLYRADNGRDLRFYYDFDALVAVEEAAGRSFKAVLEDMARSCSPKASSSESRCGKRWSPRCRS